jgi:hypothetical protein
MRVLPDFLRAQHDAVINARGRKLFAQCTVWPTFDWLSLYHLVGFVERGLPLQFSVYLPSCAPRILLAFSDSSMAIP